MLIPDEAESSHIIRRGLVALQEKATAHNSSLIAPGIQKISGKTSEVDTESEAGRWKQGAGLLFPLTLSVILRFSPIWTVDSGVSYRGVCCHM